VQKVAPVSFDAAPRLLEVFTDPVRDVPVRRGRVLEVTLVALHAAPLAKVIGAHFDLALVQVLHGRVRFTSFVKKITPVSFGTSPLRQVVIAHAILFAHSLRVF